MNSKMTVLMDLLVILFFVAIDYNFLTTPHTCELNILNGHIVNRTVCEKPFSKKWVWCTANSIGLKLTDIKCSNIIAPDPTNTIKVNFTLPSGDYLP